MRDAIPKWGRVWMLVVIVLMGLYVVLFCVSSIAWVRYSTVTWPNAPELQVKRTYGFNSGTYEYTYTSEGQLIDSRSLFFDLPPLRSGQSQTTPYFIHGTTLYIYHPGVGPGQKWVEWSVYDKVVDAWWKRYLKEGGNEAALFESGSAFEEEPASMSIENFRVRGNAWNITVLPFTTGVTDDVPSYLYFTSTDFGKTWKLLGPAILKGHIRK